MTPNPNASIHAHLEQARQAGLAGAEDGIRVGVEHVLKVSRDQVPHEEGTLERSGRATTEGLVGAVSYNTPYAVAQHEDLTFAHDPGRRAKYLENAFNSERGTVARLIAVAIRRKVGT